MEERLSSISTELRDRLEGEADPRAWFEAYIAACFADEHDERVGDYLRRRAPMVLRPETAERMSSRGPDCELAGRLREVRARTLVLHGSRDRITPLARGEELARGIRDARLVIFRAQRALSVRGGAGRIGGGARARAAPYRVRSCASVS